MASSPASNNQRLLLAAAGVTCTLALYLWRRRSQSTKTYDIPKELLQSKYGQEVVVAVELAFQAGSNMIEYCSAKGTKAEDQHDLGINTKSSPEDFCTRIDVENEQLITQGLLKQFPSHKVIGEETTGTGTIPPLTLDPTWIIDPIDGTTNFASGLPLTCVSIGLCVHAKPILGVVYAPLTHELYIAVQGVGAYCNGVCITQRQSKLLKDSVVCFEFGYARTSLAVDQMVGAVSRIMKHGCRTTRQLGSGVLDLCYVATGRLDAVYAGVAGEGWKPWDYCAGYVVTKEAGCAVEAIDQTEGTDFDLYSKSIIAAVSQDLLKEVRHVIQGK